MVLHVTVVILWMTFLMNKWTMIIIDDGWDHPLAKTLPFQRALKAALHCGGEVHQSVKSFSPGHGYLRQGMVYLRRWKDNNFFLFKLEFFGCQVSCPRHWGCPKNLISGELPFTKVSPRWHPCHFFIHVQCSLPKDSWP